MSGQVTRLEKVFVLVVVCVPLLVLQIVLLASAGFHPTNYMAGLLFMQVMLLFSVLLPNCGAGHGDRDDGATASGIVDRGVVRGRNVVAVRPVSQFVQLRKTSLISCREFVFAIVRNDRPVAICAESHYEVPPTHRCLRRGHLC